MRITLSAKNIYSLMRRAGYYFEKKEGEQMVFSRPLGSSGSGYPRFHIYVKEASHETLEANLHLDQKMPSYEGTAAHAAEYEGEVVEKEAKRIKQLFNP
ncbi:MAG: hypothetical protein DRZ76_00735 [Candidatus Nealsonbacteria bacterium]|nr:MAG: hypothetical protein DRZ76_00735 [Candidatus Nealsonbacteria bacterium]